MYFQKIVILDGAQKQFSDLDKCSCLKKGTTNRSKLSNKELCVVDIVMGQNI